MNEGDHSERFADTSTTFVLPRVKPTRVKRNRPSVSSVGEVKLRLFVETTFVRNKSLRSLAFAASQRNGCTPKTACIVRKVEAWV